MFLNSNRLIAVVTSLLVLGLVSCHYNDGGKGQGARVITALMDSAEHVLNDHPEKSLQLMKSNDLLVSIVLSRHQSQQDG